MAAPLNVVITGDDDTRKAFSSLNSSIRKSTKQSKSLLATFRDLSIVLGTDVIRATKTFVAVLNGANEAAKRQQKAEIAVAVGLAQIEKNAVASFHALQKWNSEMGRSTGIADEYLLELESIGINLGRMANEQLKDATAASLDFAMATGKDAVTAMTALSKLMATGRADFGELGITVDMTRGKTHAFNDAIGKMRSGLAAAIGASPLMQLDRLKGAITETFESIGILIASSRTFKAFMGALSGGVLDLASAMRDPAFIRKWATMFDGFVISVISGFRKLSEVVFLVVGSIIEGVAAIAKAMDKIAFGMLALKGTADAALSAAEAVKGLGKEVDAFSVSMTKAILNQDVFDPSTFIRGIVDTVKQAIANGLNELKGSKRRWSEEMVALFDSIAITLGEETNILGDLITADKIEGMRDQIIEAGESWAALLSQTMTEGLVEEGGMGEAFSKLGSNARDQFMAQMSVAAFAPLKATMGIVAETVSLPFRMMSTLINDEILQPIAKFGAKVIKGLIAGVIEAFSTQAAVAATIPGTFAAVQASFLPLLGTLTAGAVAASISSFGAATAFGPAALAAIKLAGVSALAGFAEGGLVFPESGNDLGRVVRVAEQQPEFIVPASDAASFARQFGGGGGGDMIVNIDTIGADARVDDLQALADRVAEVFEDRLSDAVIAGER